MVSEPDWYNNPYDHLPKEPQMTNQLPAYLQQRQSQAIGRTLQDSLGAGAVPYLSIDNDRFTLVDAVGNKLPLTTVDPQIGWYADIAIVDANKHKSRVFWGPDRTYNPDDPSPPVCVSDNGFAPGRQSQEPQAPTCAQCQWSVWGSKVSQISGKGIPACGEMQKLAFTIAGHKTVFLLRVGPNSLKQLREYQGKFSGQPFDITDVITRVTFVPGVRGTLQFSAVGYIDEATYQLREQIAEAHAADAIVGRLDTVHPHAAMLPASTPTTALPAPQGNPSPFPQQSSMPSAPQNTQNGPFNQAGPAQAHPGGQSNMPNAPSSAAPAMQPSGQPAPFMPASAPFANAPSTATATQQTQSAPTAGNAASPSKRRGRPPAQPAQQAAQPAQAPFPVNGPTNNFGIQPGVAPNQELAATLNSLFPQS